MVILYQTAKFKSANIFAVAIWGPTTKFNSRQYFRLYGTPGTRNSEKNLEAMNKKDKGSLTTIVQSRTDVTTQPKANMNSTLMIQKRRNC